LILSEPRSEPSPGTGGDPRQELGRLGEQAAAALLCEAGYRVLERRYRKRTGELDLVVERGELVVFVEVKARRDVECGDPAEAVTAVKRRRMARTALAFLAGRDWAHRPCRFDVIEVLAAGGEVSRIRHIEDAFRIWPTG
jgi:putative endonuclease